LGQKPSKGGIPAPQGSSDRPKLYASTKEKPAGRDHCLGGVDHSRSSISATLRPAAPVDYFNIDLKNAIQGFGADAVLAAESRPTRR
jgi:hypothetical protein